MVMQAEVSQSSDIKVRFDVYDRNGSRVNNKKILQFPTTGAGMGAVGVGSMPIGGVVGANGSSGSATTLILSETRDDVTLYQVWRVVIRFTGNDKVPHVINFFSLETEDRNDPVRLNNLNSI